MRTQRPTIVDVAKHAGVSKSTVSLVIQKPDSVKEKTRVLVRQAMTELGYVYNRAAASMRSRKAGLVGVIINDLRNPFFSEFAATFQDELAKSGYVAVLANSNEDAQQQVRLIKTMIQHGVSALVISPAYGDLTGSFDDLIRAGIPTIQVLRQIDERTEYFPFIAPDYFEGSKLATGYLVKEGAKRIAFVGGLPSRPVTLERCSGYLAVMEQNDLQPIVHHGMSNRDFGGKAAVELAHSHPELDAVLCFNDFVALGYSAGLTKQYGEKRPNIRIVGFDDIEEVQHAMPGITSVSCDISGLAVQTASAMVQRLTLGQLDWRIKRTTVRLVIRN